MLDVHKTIIKFCISFWLVVEFYSVGEGRGHHFFFNATFYLFANIRALRQVRFLLYHRTDILCFNVSDDPPPLQSSLFTKWLLFWLTEEDEELTRLDFSS